MAPLITLTTDFGTRDGFVGAMKGRILSICPEANIIDITHDIPAQGILQCSWTLFRSTMQFPEESIHVVVVDPGVGSIRRPVLIRSEKRWYIGPDNGIFSEIIREFGTEEVYQIQTKTEWWEAHTTFDGLALFAPAGAYLAKGLKPEEFCGPIDRLLTITPKSVPKMEGGVLQGKILMFDRFGNALTDISKSHLEAFDKVSFKISCRTKSFPFVTHYEAGKGNESLALINSDGFLELSTYSGSAEQALGLKSGDPVTIR